MDPLVIYWILGNIFTFAFLLFLRRVWKDSGGRDVLWVTGVAYALVLLTWPLMFAFSILSFIAYGIGWCIEKVGKYRESKDTREFIDVKYKGY